MNGHVARDEASPLKPTRFMVRVQFRRNRELIKMPLDQRQGRRGLPLSRPVDPRSMALPICVISLLVSLTLRRWTTWLCLAGFLFMQGTLIAYACPLRGPLAAAGAVQSVALDDSGEACPGHAQPADTDTDPACVPHCENQTGVSGSGTPQLPPLALAPFLVAVAAPVTPASVLLVAHQPLDANAAAPPIALQFCRLLF